MYTLTNFNMWQNFVQTIQGKLNKINDVHIYMKFAIKICNVIKEACFNLLEKPSSSYFWMIVVQLPETFKYTYFKISNTLL